MITKTPLTPTEVPGLDAVLDGGIATNDLIFILGPPGAGKTVLAGQIIFMAARRGAPSLILTSYSEGNIKLLQHLQSFAFYDDALVGGAVNVLTLQSLTTTDAVASALAIAKTIRETGAQFVFIDGLQGIAPVLLAREALRPFLASLSNHLPYLNTTVIITLAGDARDPALYAEITASDITIDLTYTVSNRQHVRLLEVVKHRGHAQLPGQHAYLLDDSGIQVLPRLEVYPKPASRPHKRGRVAFGLPELDNMLGGGLTSGTSTVLAGAPGTGKTTLALSWALCEASRDAQTVYLSLQEHVAQLEEKAAAFGLDLSGAIAEGALTFLRLEPVELNPDIFAQQLLRALEGRAVQRLVIDDMAVLLYALGARAPDYLAALMAQLYGAGITTLVLLEIPLFTGFRIDLQGVPVGVMAENLIVLQQQEIGGVLRRLLAVVRMRYSTYDRTIRELVLDAQGIQVLHPKDTEQGVLAAAAAESGGVAPSELGEPPEARSPQGS